MSDTLYEKIEFNVHWNSPMGYISEAFDCAKDAKEFFEEVSLKGPATLYRTTTLTRVEKLNETPIHQG